MLPVRVIARVVPVYLHSSDVIVSLLGLLLGCFDMRDSQQNQNRQETPSSSPGMEPHIGDQSSRGNRSALQVKKL